MSKFDIDRLGMLTLQHFESQFESDSSWGESSHSNTELSSNASSPPYSAEEFESPGSSPTELKPPIGTDTFWEPNDVDEKIANGPSEDIEEGNWHEQERASRYKRGRRGKETISKRNERERRRVRLISEGFGALRQRVMIQPGSRKLPKLQILRKAILYIKNLQEMIEESDLQNGSTDPLVLRRSTAPQMAYMYDSSFINEQSRNMQTNYVDTQTLQKHETNIYQQVPRAEKPWLQGYTV